MAVSTYKVWDTTTGMAIGPSIPNVIVSTDLTAVATTAASAEVTCASTTGVWPGMQVAIATIPWGAWVKAVNSSTTFVVEMLLDQPPAEWRCGDGTGLYAGTVTYAVGDYIRHRNTGCWYRCTKALTSTFSSTALATFAGQVLAGYWTEVPRSLRVPALATATASGKIGHVLGFNQVAIPDDLYIGTNYRNELSPTYKSTTLSAYIPTELGADPLTGGSGFAPETVFVKGTSEVTGDMVRAQVADSVSHVEPRHERSWASFYRLVATGGAVTKVPARSNLMIVAIS